jgi:signal transduction histidine kinase/CheY-like chemotaxis protein
MIFTGSKFRKRVALFVRLAMNAHHVPLAIRHETQRSLQRVGFGLLMPFMGLWVGQHFGLTHQPMAGFWPLACAFYGAFAAGFLLFIRYVSCKGLLCLYIFVFLDPIVTIAMVAYAPEVFAWLGLLLLMIIVRTGLRYGMQLLIVSWVIASLSSAYFIFLGNLFETAPQAASTVVACLIIGVPLFIPTLRLKANEQHVALERVKLESQLDSLATKTKFFDMVGHDLRSPLQGLVGAAKLAALNESASERVRFADIVQERSSYFTRLLDDLTNLSRGDALSFHHDAMDIGAWCDSAATRYRQLAEAKGLSFRSRCDVAHKFILFDRERLTQVVDNLMSNALRYTKEGFIDFDVFCKNFSHQSKDCVLTIQVRDTGSGIPNADQARVFEPYVRLNESVPGMGLGLGVVASVARSVGGSVTVVSDVGVGSTFTFAVPVPIASAVNPLPEERRSAHPITAAPIDVIPAPQCVTRKAPAVLVVDDDPVIAEVLGALIPHMGFQTTIARSGLEGIACASGDSFVAILTDMQMPHMSGEEMALHIRGLLKPCPTIISMTAYGGANPQFNRSCFDAVLIKPVNDAELLSLLDAAATRWTEITA